MTQSLAGRHLTVFCLLCVLLAPTFAARADETTELIARLRDAAKKQPFTLGYSYELSRFGFQEAGGVMAEIAVAQVALGDLDGALETAAAVPIDRQCMNCGDSFKFFLHDLSVALAEARRYDAAFEVLKRHHDNQKIPADERLAIARAQARAGDFHAAQRTCQETIHAIELDPYICCGSKDEFGAVSDLASVAFAQVSIGDRPAARTTRERVAALLRKLPTRGDGWTQIMTAQLAVLDAKLGNRAAARRGLQDIAQVLEQKPPAGQDRLIDSALCRRYFAEASCHLGDFADANRTLSHIDGGWSGEAYASIALCEWSQRRFDDARATILAGPPSESRGLVQVEIAKAQAQFDRNYKGALVTVAQIKNDTIRARGRLEVAAVMANHGLRETAQLLALRLDFPRLEEFGNRATMQFKFDDLKTWSEPYEGSKGDSILSMLAGESLDGDLLAAAVRCRVALQGRGAIPFLIEMNKHWDVQKAAEAQASEGDAAGALAWADKLLTPECRLVALVATAEGHAEFRARSHPKQGDKLRLGRRDSLNPYLFRFGHLFGDD